MAGKYEMSENSITVQVDGESYTVKRGDDNFDAVREAVQAKNWGKVPALLNLGVRISAWARGMFSFREGALFYKGERLPEVLYQRIEGMVEGGHDPSILFRFWERLARNPSKNSVAQLFGFLEHTGMPLTKQGTILTYKRVKKSLFDCHTGNTHHYAIGSIVTMPREDVVDDAGRACGPGLHVGTLDYVGSFASSDSPILIIEVDPADVVSVPSDHNQQKMRVCALKVLGHFSGEGFDTAVWDEDCYLGTEELNELALHREELRAQDAEELVTGYRGASSLKGEPVLFEEGETSPMGDAERVRRDVLSWKSTFTLRNVALAAGVDRKLLTSVWTEDAAIIDAIIKAEASAPTPVASGPEAAEPLKDDDPTEESEVLFTAGGKAYPNLHSLDEEGLGGRSLADLRKYAVLGLAIIGGGRIPGGKPKLIEKILEVREVRAEANENLED